MARYFEEGFLIIIVLTGLAFFVRTPESVLPPPLASAESTAEFGDVSLTIEYATTTAARELGLGNRTSIPDNYGMLFVFPKDDLYGFWMKDTLVPLDMFWLDSKGQVVSVANDVAPSTYPHVFYPSVPARYVLETASGFARVHGITIGTRLLLKNLPIVSK